MHRILVVDDDIGTIETFARLLGLAGFEVVTEVSGLIAMRMLQEELFDLAIVDLRLEDSDGTAVVAGVLGRIPVIMISGSADIGSAVRAMKLGATDFLEKPILEEQLISAVERALACRMCNQSATTSAASSLGRWVRAVIGVVDSGTDPRTVEQWATSIGSSAGALRCWCSAAGIGAKNSLDLARILRACWRAQQTGWPVRRFLDIADERTLRRLLQQGGLEHVDSPKGLSEVLERQTFVPDPAAVGELARALDGRSSIHDR